MLFSWRTLLLSCLFSLALSNNAIPNIDLPLITSSNDPFLLDDNYGKLAKLVGTWNSPVDFPTGYNVMPVPAGNQESESGGKQTDWQSKNFYYYEEMTFTAPGEAPNRGQLFQQGCYGLTYEQRVYFAPNPKKKGLGNLVNQPDVPFENENTLVHFENGLWLSLVYEAQPKGAYAPPSLPFPPKGTEFDPPTQPADTQIVKQVSVPHGNSILAVGSVTTYKGPPTFDTSPPDAPPFSFNASIMNPTHVLVAQLDSLGSEVRETTEFNISTTNAGGGLGNLVFEQGNADVTGYETRFFIEELRDGTVQLQYVQTILMEFDLTLDPSGTAEPDDGRKVAFRHVTANTLIRNDGEECKGAFRK